MPHNNHIKHARSRQSINFGNNEGNSQHCIFDNSLVTTLFVLVSRVSVEMSHRKIDWSKPAANFQFLAINIDKKHAPADAARS